MPLSGRDANNAFYASGDLGTTVSEVEVALETHFALATRWGCILLLDEADVFLAPRTPQDFERNGLLSGLAPCVSLILFMPKTNKLSVLTGTGRLCRHFSYNHQPDGRL